MRSTLLTNLGAKVLEKSWVDEYFNPVLKHKNHFCSQKVFNIYRTPKFPKYYRPSLGCPGPGRFFPSGPRNFGTRAFFFHSYFNFKARFVPIFGNTEIGKQKKNLRFLTSRTTLARPVHFFWPVLI